MIVAAAMLLAYNLYSSYRFWRDFERIYPPQIAKKEQEILRRMAAALGYSRSFPIIITDRLPDSIFGLSAKDRQGGVKIYLNKHRFKESFSYILDDVLAHEYAHALLLARNYKAKSQDGHDALWQQLCKALGGTVCRRYVDKEELVRQKLQNILH